ncbi:hypothetical protein CHLRE_17g712800v5 [Chlamydomonas reinhardtii]|uniref:Uncharacterized protein n=1 Tax=Chlamydomonas reinhardtii TaxID=3055 RepID=A0A2K3CPR9_CHLRE|nr:uncharacterized protein CHLRE_17g712800v5 [Chlamydomonas reinhardtii]PNW70268.1 hypothetical protein CHLRE_17g712800v5 [Chlamydomonas reinhardtii]
MRLTPELIHCIAERLSPYEPATTLRLLNKETAAALRGEYGTIALAQTISPKGLKIAVSPWPGRAFVAHWSRPEPWRTLTLQQRRQLLCLAASSHDVASLEVALAFSGAGLTREVVDAAAAGGDRAALQRLIEEGCDRSARAAELAACYGHVHILQWITADADPARSLWEALGYYSDADVAKAACAGGQGHVLTWFEGGKRQQQPAAAAAGQQAAGQEGQVGQGAQQEGRGAEPVRPEGMAGRTRSHSRRLLPTTAAAPSALSFRELVVAAADGGHVDLVSRLMRPDGVYAIRLAMWKSFDWSVVLNSVAAGCPVAFLQQFYDDHLPFCFPAVDDESFILALSQVLCSALSSGGDDWQAKAELLLSRWAALAAVSEAAGERVRAALPEAASWWRRTIVRDEEARPGMLQRCRYLAALVEEAAAVAAAAGGGGGGGAEAAEASGGMSEASDDSGELEGGAWWQGAAADWAATVGDADALAELLDWWQSPGDHSA